VHPLPARSRRSKSSKKSVPSLARGRSRPHLGARGDRDRRAGARAHRAEVLLIREQRAEIAFLRKQFNFYQAKCERLELSILEAKAGAPAAYVDRTEVKTRTAIGKVPIRAGKLRHSQILEAWNKLSAEEQDSHIAAGDWKLEPEAKKKRKERTH